ncbi:SDR family NAD(P)-dependent oxidoreductase [Streptomyces sp. Li-HN-5-11]|uniref:SDR family NAD(P)-dependent oxidoreductase n=1 Tax=Streptomyces sp. Li-HN-5-11 TaxID=3075432 RepID=UPI0028A92C53|nr:SDR family NAD(P)-dependent oxidoreductase [Streptomyces sp. Li-HN-5-11]WNM31729.1 SDR family NAD(P)-dependent oxidoreductase [Streptomyces sp. Li-HN-5-11]
MPLYGKLCVPPPAKVCAASMSNFRRNASVSGGGNAVRRPVAVITGAAKGIGFEVAKRLAPTHRVALLDRDETALQEATATIGADAAGFVCEITDSASVASAITAVVDRFDRIDVAISNAGIGVVGVARHLDPDALAGQLDVNLTGNWRFMHACLPHLISSRGYVLAVASAAALAAPPAEGFYAASKAGLEALVNVVRVEVAHLGVDVGVAYPMFVATPMVQTADADHPDLLYVRKKLSTTDVSASDAAARLVRAVERRSSHVFVPGSVRFQHVFRGVIRPLIDRVCRRIAPEVDRLTAAKVAERGPLGAAFNRPSSPVQDKQV